MRQSHWLSLLCFWRMRQSHALRARSTRSPTRGCTEILLYIKSEEEYASQEISLPAHSRECGNRIGYHYSASGECANRMRSEHGLRDHQHGGVRKFYFTSSRRRNMHPKRLVFLRILVNAAIALAITTLLLANAPIACAQSTVYAITNTGVYGNSTLHQVGGGICIPRD